MPWDIEVWLAVWGDSVAYGFSLHQNEQKPAKVYTSKHTSKANLLTEFIKWLISHFLIVKWHGLLAPRTNQTNG
jgi:hypothetical protein